LIEILNLVPFDVVIRNQEIISFISNKKYSIF